MYRQNRKTKIIHLISNGDVETLLGVIKWFGAWRQYCFFPEENTLYNNECLKDNGKLMICGCNNVIKLKIEHSELIKYAQSTANELCAFNIVNI